MCIWISKLVKTDEVCKMKILSKIENANDIPSKEFVDQKIVGLTEQ